MAHSWFVQESQLKWGICRVRCCTNYSHFSRVQKQNLSSQETSIAGQCSQPACRAFLCAVGGIRTTHIAWARMSTTSSQHFLCLCAVASRYPWTMRTPTEDLHLHSMPKPAMNWQKMSSKSRKEKKTFRNVIRSYNWIVFREDWSVSPSRNGYVREHSSHVDVNDVHGIVCNFRTSPPDNSDCTLLCGRHAKWKGHNNHVNNNNETGMASQLIVCYSPGNALRTSHIIPP